MSEVEAAKKLRSTAKEEFTRVANNLSQAIYTGVPTTTIESRYDELKAAWNEAQNKHDDFVKLLPCEELDEDRGIKIEEESKTFSELEVKTDSYLENVSKTKGPGGHSLIWPIRGRAAGQGMVFGLSALNRVYNFMGTYPRQGLNLS